MAPKLIIDEGQDFAKERNEPLESLLMYQATRNLLRRALSPRTYHLTHYVDWRIRYYSTRRIACEICPENTDRPLQPAAIRQLFAKDDEQPYLPCSGEARWLRLIAFTRDSAPVAW